MTISAICLDDLHPSIDNFGWAGSVVSDLVDRNGERNAQRWTTKHLVVDIFWCHIQDNFGGHKID